jgi:osmoprotectant transport system permease protein
MRPGEPLILWDWTFDHLPDIGRRLVEHLELTGVAVVVGFVIAFCLGLAIRQAAWLYAPVTWVTGVLYTIPSLALFALLIPFTGLSIVTAEIGLVGYTLLIIIRNVVAGLDAVPADVRDAAKGMGFSPARQFWRVEFPLALPAIIAGVRIATVTTIGLVTVTALIGKGGLGSLIYDGLTRDFKTPLTVGAVISVLLAIMADSLLVGVQRLLTPWARRGR